MILMVMVVILMVMVMVIMASDQCTAVTRDLQLGPHVGDCKSDVK